MTCGGKSHSGISGSKAACAYPELIAACHALRQRPSRAIRQVAYHAKPFRNPHSICVSFEALCTALIVNSAFTLGLTLLFATKFRAWKLHLVRLVAGILPSNRPCSV